MQSDPLSGTKAAADFITDFMHTRDGEQSEVEKAHAGSDSALSEDGQHLYDTCKAGMAQAGADSSTADKVCHAYAEDFDRRHAGGFAEVLPNDVSKTVSVAGMSADLGTPSTEVALTDVGGKRLKRGQG